MLAGKFLDGLEEIRRTLKVNFNEGIDTFVSIRDFWDARSAKVCVWSPLADCIIGFIESS